jgi:hypothetical protein
LLVPLPSSACCCWCQGTFTLLPLRCFWALLTLASAPSARARTKAATYAPGGGRLLPGNQLYDLACVALLGASLWTLLLLPPGRIYYWMKDVISEFLRIQVLFTALELLDKVCVCGGGGAAAGRGGGK